MGWMIFGFIVLFGFELLLMFEFKDEAKNKVLYWTLWIIVILAPYGIIPLVVYLWRFVNKTVAGFVAGCLSLTFIGLFIAGNILSINKVDRTGEHYIFKHGQRATEIIIGVMRIILYAIAAAFFIFGPALCFYSIIGYLK